MRNYIFVFRNAENSIVAIRSYADTCESNARQQAERDSYSLDAFRVTRAVGYQRSMIFG